MRGNVSAPGRAGLWLLAGLLVLMLVELLRTAWLSDDAAITLRVVLNFLHGFGPVFNIDERVQAYTHPLWFLLLTALSALVGNVFVAAYALGLLLSLAVAWLLTTRLATGGIRSGLLAMLVMLLSKAWVDFSTSGLENPLSHLLLLLFLLVVLRTGQVARAAELGRVFLLCSLLYLTRPDLLLIVAPVASWLVLRGDLPWRERWRAVAWGLSPAIAWTAFSIAYYGVPFPNTAYAKLMTGLSLGERWARGALYLLDSVHRDPLTPVVIVAGLILAWRRANLLRLMAAGVALYLVYVVSIGGDFMSGRFLTAPLAVALAIGVRESFAPGRAALLAVAVIGLGWIALPSTLLSGRDYLGSEFTPEGIADERGYYFRYPGHALINGHPPFPDLPPWEAGPRTVSEACGGLGVFALANGPSDHVVDTCALSDPLLARLPAQRKARWRIGHLQRQLPTDYLSSVASGENRLADPAMRDYYDVIRRVTRGPLWDAQRWRDIVQLNLGLVPVPDLEPYRTGQVPRTSRIPKMPVVPLSRVAPGTGYIGFLRSVGIALPAGERVGWLSMELGVDDTYVLLCEADGETRELASVPPGELLEGGAPMHAVELVISPPCPGGGIIKVLGQGGDGKFALGAVRMLPAH